MARRGASRVVVGERRSDSSPTRGVPTRRRPGSRSRRRGANTRRPRCLFSGPGGKPGWFLDMNPRGTVPVVAVDGVVFANSESILDAVGDGEVGVDRGMLRRTDGQSPDGRALADRWRISVSDRLIPVGKSAVLGGRGGSATAELRTLLKDLNAMVAGPYLVGEGLSLADCAAFPFLLRIDREFGIGGVGEENLRSWLDRCMETDPIKLTIPVRGWWWWW